MSKYSSESLGDRAEKAGFQLRNASTQTRIQAAGNHEPMPRWEVDRIGNQRADGVRGFAHLSDVAEFLGNQEVMADMNPSRVTRSRASEATPRPPRAYGVADPAASKAKKHKL